MLASCSINYNPGIHLCIFFQEKWRSITKISYMTGIRMFISILFIIVPNWNQSVLHQQNIALTYFGLYIQGNTTQNKNEWTNDVHNNVEESEKHYTEWKKPVSKENIFYDFKCVKF